MHQAAPVLGFLGIEYPTGLCSVDDQLVTNVGNMIVRSSDPVLGRVDVPAQISGTQKPLSSVVSVNQQEATFLNTFSSPIRMNHPLMPQLANSNESPSYAPRRSI